MKRTMLALAALAAAGSAAFAQGSPLSPPATAPGQSPNRGSPAIANSGPGATGSISTEGTGAGTISNNAAAAGNSSTPERAVPNSNVGGSGGTGGN